MNKYLAKMVIAVLFLISANSVFSQQCEDGTAKFGKRYVYYGAQRITRAEGSESRMAIAFKPNSGGIKIGDKIVFTPSMPAGGDWYVIYQKAEDFPADVEKYFFPLEPGALPADSETRDVKIVPPTKYYYKDNLIASLGGTDGRTVKSTVKKLPPSMELDTKGWEPGLYWFTLQNTAVPDVKNSTTCSKTTPPVAIQLVTPTPPPPPNKNPWVDIDVAGQDCDARTVTFTGGDPDNEPGAKLYPQNLTLKWRLKNSRGEVQKTDEKSLGAKAKFTETITPLYLTPGTYTVEADIADDFDPLGRDSDSKTFTLDCSTAGIVYFQFDEPFESDTRRITFDPANYTEPESWVAVNPRVRVRNQCAVEQGLYPPVHFLPFYNFWSSGQPVPAIDFNNNSRTMERIANVLIDDPGYTLVLYGYADFRNSKDYNTSLVNRRLDVVEAYLKTAGVTAKIERVVMENWYDSRAVSCYGEDFTNACTPGRKQDRRVELMYFINREPVLPTYDPSGCPANAMINIRVPGNAIGEGE